MGIHFVDPVKDYSLAKLIIERDRWERMAGESSDEHVEKHRREVVATYSAEIERLSKLSSIAQLIDRGYADVKDELKKCHVSYRSGPAYEHLRKDHANVTLYGSDGKFDSQINMHKSKVDQYLQDHGIDPNSQWFDSIHGQPV